jgi:hypothetical protein
MLSRPQPLTLFDLCCAWFGSSSSRLAVMGGDLLESGPAMTSRTTTKDLLWFFEALKLGQKKFTKFPQSVVTVGNFHTPVLRSAHILLHMLIFLNCKCWYIDQTITCLSSHSHSVPRGAFSRLPFDWESAPSKGELDHTTKFPVRFSSRYHFQ